MKKALPPSEPQPEQCDGFGTQPSTPEESLFLIRQINYRITEQLKSTYPAVSWLWVIRPSAKELCKGGTWRIRTSGTEPFNFGEVTLSAIGKLDITMLQAMPLHDAASMAEDDMDLKQEELLERVDVKEWFTDKGEELLCMMIDDLNTQGHKRMTITEDGSVMVGAFDSEQIVDHIEEFPPRMVWEDFRQLLREDDIQSSIDAKGLVLSWS